MLEREESRAPIKAIDEATVRESTGSRATRAPAHARTPPPKPRRGDVGIRKGPLDGLRWPASGVRAGRLGRGARARGAAGCARALPPAPPRVALARRRAAGRLSPDKIRGAQGQAPRGAPRHELQPRRRRPRRGGQRREQGLGPCRYPQLSRAPPEPATSVPRRRTTSPSRSRARSCASPDPRRSFCPESPPPSPPDASPRPATPDPRAQIAC